MAVWKERLGGTGLGSEALISQSTGRGRIERWLMDSNAFSSEALAKEALARRLLVRKMLARDVLARKAQIFVHEQVSECGRRP